MKKRPPLLIIIALIVLLALSLSWWSRDRLAASLANTLLQKQEIVIDHLRWGYSYPATLVINTVQLEHPQATINMAKLSYDMTSNELVVDNIDIQHHPVESSVDNKTTSGSWSLPQWLPQLSVHQLAISSPWLKKPFKARLSQQRSNELIIDAGWQARISLKQHQLHGAIRWQLSDLALMFEQPMPLNALLETTFDFDGQYFQSQHHIELADTVEEWPCSPLVEASGNFDFNYNIANNQGLALLNKLPITVTPTPHCALLDSVPVSLRPTKATLNIDTPISIDDQTVYLTHASLQLQGSECHYLLELKKLVMTEMRTIESHYQLSMNGPHTTHLQSEGELSASTDNSNSNSNTHWQINSPKNHFDTAHLHLNDIKADKLSSTFHFSADDSKGLSIGGQYSAASLQQGKTLKLSGISGNFDLSGSLAGELKGLVNNRIADLTDYSQAETTSLQAVNSKLNLNLKANGSARFDGKTAIRSGKIMGYKLGSLRITHAGSWSDNQLASNHQFTTPAGLELTLQQHEQKLLIQLPRQGILGIEPFLSQIDSQFDLSSGWMAAKANVDLASMQIDSSLKLVNINGHYQDYEIENFNFRPKFQLKNNKLDVSPSPLSLTRLSVGVDITQLHTIIGSRDGNIEARNIIGQVFDGHFQVPLLTIDSHPQQAIIEAYQIDASKLISLEQQSGITVSGRLRGQLPLHISPAGVEIKDGYLVNQGQGSLRIENNAAFDGVKAQQQELGHILSLLEHLDFTAIDSQVNLSTEGWLSLKMQIQGYNAPQAQQVNFNYHHEENIFTLMKAMRMGDIIEDQVIQGFEDK
ncbi:intermembrane phospholipid transport protein YdbH family protein [Sinobacterium caligoides]|nr:YdbH domain-containing protein [Sinobacterium caligoides]